MNILYIPGSYYLSNKIFLSIAKAAKKHINIYFDTKDPGFSGTNTINPDGSMIDYHFDYHYVLHNPITIRGIKDLKVMFAFQIFKQRLYTQLEKFKPDIIIVSTDMGGNINRMINNWAEKNNIPFIVIQTAFLGSAKYNTKDAMRNKLGYLLFNKILDIPLFRRQEMYGCEKKSNYLFLWGTDFKKMYKGTCIEKNIRLVGNPVFDNIQQRINTIIFDKKIALLCPSMFSGVISKSNEIKIRKMYQDVIKQNPNVHFIVKVHPRETMEQYDELLKNCGDNFWITKNADLYDLLSIADVQISLASYTSFEALVAGVPVILLGTHMLQFPFDQFNHKAAFKVNSIEEFNWALTRCLNKKYIRQFRKLRVNYLSTKLKYLGSSAEHIIDELEMIVE